MHELPGAIAQAHAAGHLEQAPRGGCHGWCVLASAGGLIPALLQEALCCSSVAPGQPAPGQRDKEGRRLHVSGTHWFTFQKIAVALGHAEASRSLSI